MKVKAEARREQQTHKPQLNEIPDLSSEKKNSFPSGGQVLSNLSELSKCGSGCCSGTSRYTVMFCEMNVFMPDCRCDVLFVEFSRWFTHHFINIFVLPSNTLLRYEGICMWLVSDFRSSSTLFVPLHWCWYPDKSQQTKQVFNENVSWIYKTSPPM